MFEWEHTGMALQVEPGHRVVTDEIECVATPDSLAIEPLNGRQIGSRQTSYPVATV
jgi:hypothetical protein